MAPPEHGGGEMPAPQTTDVQGRPTDGPRAQDQPWFQVSSEIKSKVTRAILGMLPVDDTASGGMVAAGEGAAVN